MVREASLLVRYVGCVQRNLFNGRPRDCMSCNKTPAVIGFFINFTCYSFILDIIMSTGANWACTNEAPGD